MTDFHERRCYTCPGTIRLKACAGRTVETPGCTAEIPATLAIPTCDQCGDELIDAALAQKLDAILLEAQTPLPPEETASDNIDVDPAYLDPDFGLAPLTPEEFLRNLKDG